MKLTDFVSKVETTALDDSYIETFIHGYEVTMNDDHSKSYPVFLMSPPTRQRLTRRKNWEKIYNVKFYIFDLSVNLTRMQRDQLWQNQEDSLDRIIDIVTADESVILASEPLYESWDDEEAQLYGEQVCWTEATFQLKILNCE